MSTQSLASITLAAPSLFWPPTPPVTLPDSLRICVTASGDWVLLHDDLTDTWSAKYVIVQPSLIMVFSNYEDLLQRPPKAPEAIVNAVVPAGKRLKYKIGRRFKQPYCFHLCCQGLKWWFALRSEAATGLWAHILVQPMNEEMTMRLNQNKLFEPFAQVAPVNARTNTSAVTRRPTIAATTDDSSLQHHPEQRNLRAAAATLPVGFMFPTFDNAFINVATSGDKTEQRTREPTTLSTSGIALLTSGNVLQGALEPTAHGAHSGMLMRSQSESASKTSMEDKKDGQVRIGQSPELDITDAEPAPLVITQSRQKHVAVKPYVSFTKSRLMANTTADRPNYREQEQVTKNTDDPETTAPSQTKSQRRLVALSEKSQGDSTVTSTSNDKSDVQGSFVANEVETDCNGAVPSLTNEQQHHSTVEQQPAEHMPNPQYQALRETSDDGAILLNDTAVNDDIDLSRNGVENERNTNFALSVSSATGDSGESEEPLSLPRNDDSATTGADTDANLARRRMKAMKGASQTSGLIVAPSKPRLNVTKHFKENANTEIAKSMNSAIAGPANETISPLKVGSVSNNVFVKRYIDVAAPESETPVDFSMTMRAGNELIRNNQRLKLSSLPAANALPQAFVDQYGRRDCWHYSYLVVPNLTSMRCRDCERHFPRFEVVDLSG
uniref:Uncharacterized protein n=1 Tax=Spongospora subterranea TaxID=70186 RepID=A0A0H5R4T6_9EUKA|eukprot:CRZ03109.1 hypothetical protein [Spongospora subterranea]